MHASLLVYFKAIQTRRRDLSFAVPDKAGNVLGLALGGLEALEELGWNRTQLQHW